MGAQDVNTLQAYFKTNSQLVHKHFTEAKPIDASQAEAQRKKLSQANFNMGKSPMQYTTTTDSSHPALQSEQLNNIVDRQRAANFNHMTNFINKETGGYEKLPEKIPFGRIPEKNSNKNEVDLKNLITDLKSSHFTVGHAHKDPFSYLANKTYGAGQSASNGKEKVPWATRKTNFVVGTDPNKTVTDYNARFNRFGSATTRVSDALNIKTKIEGSDVKISGNNEVHANVSSHDQFKNVYPQSRNIN